MPRNARQTSTSGYYHVIFRGVNRQDIFLDNEDRQRFLQTLNRYRKETEVNILVFCLMDNHVHILARADSAPGSMVQKILCSYVPYFNKKYGRVGHLFSSRYYSGTLETERAVLAVAKYILRNPLKAGLSAVQDYPWSSWREISLWSKNSPKICDIQPLIALAGSKNELVAFVLADDPAESMQDKSVYRNGDDDFRPYRRWTEHEAYEIMQKSCGGINPLSIASLPKSDRDHLLRHFKKMGISVRQISRLTGIERNSVQRA